MADAEDTTPETDDAPTEGTTDEHTDEHTDEGAPEGNLEHEDTGTQSPSDVVASDADEDGHVDDAAAPDQPETSTDDTEHSDTGIDPVSKPSEDDTETIGEPAVTIATQLLIDSQHADTPEIVDQQEQLQDELDGLREEAQSKVSTVDVATTRDIFEENTKEPRYRRNVDDLTDEEKELPSDAPTPDGDGAAPLSDEHAAAKERERDGKNSTLPKFDEREQYDDDTPLNEKDQDRKGSGGRGGSPRSDESDEPVHIVGDQHVYTADQDTTFREIATALGLNNWQEIAHINGRYDGTELVTAGTQLLLPTGYDYQ